MFMLLICLPVLFVLFVACVPVRTAVLKCQGLIIHLPHAKYLTFLGRPASTKITPTRGSN
jgi:hypothetical protein